MRAAEAWDEIVLSGIICINNTLKIIIQYDRMKEEIPLKCNAWTNCKRGNTFPLYKGIQLVLF